MSDEGVEEQLAQNLLFRCFAGLGLSDGSADHTVIWRFHKLISEKGLSEVLIHEVNAQLASHNLIILTGVVSIINASIIDAKSCRPKKGKDGRNTQNKDVIYTSKRASNGKQKTTYGYKLHANSDEDGFDLNFSTTPVNVHDSNKFNKLLTGNEHQMYADSAYKSKKQNRYFKALGIENRIHHRGYRNKPLTKEQKQANTWRLQVRNRVESVFGILQLHYRASKASHHGMMQLNTAMGFASMAYNLKRAAKLQGSYAYNQAKEAHSPAKR